MRLPGSEKLEIIRLVEQSHLPARRTLEILGIRPSTFYRWYDRYRAGGPEALEDKPSRPDRVWNRIPDDIRDRIVAMALEVPELSPRELATRFTRQALVRDGPVRLEEGLKRWQPVRNRGFSGAGRSERSARDRRGTKDIS